ncbi:NADH-quinone oxidoreductase subunit J [Halopseudomonas nanhaiensis]|uniref:complex I subunit 5 family protein n=1 Tax=Halopseudomonas nanhaiensis TaxID=2830842 RepID=UPI001CBF4B15|nr:proton-conducting transporter membrane subunit [Halopseudomonas nanhaiensis]UAW98693.1 NADH-quinone oxidoreductase subunit J [Halopseudomonas nanhaiensis]
MLAALGSLSIPLATALLLLLLRIRSGYWVILSSLASLLCAGVSLQQAVQGGTMQLAIGGWAAPLGIRFEISMLSSLLLCYTALIHMLVAVYAARSRHSETRHSDYWPLSSLLHASLAALWLSRDLFNWYVTLELLGLGAVAMIALAGRHAYSAALRYLLLSLAGSLCYLLGVALLYGRYGVLDIGLLGSMTVDDATTRVSLLLITLGLMTKGALWPLHMWLPDAHSRAPTAVSALLSALVVKGPLFILWLVWSRIAPTELAVSIGPLFGIAGVLALIGGGWSALRTGWLKRLVAYSTVAQLGYALLALGLLLHWRSAILSVALWLFVLAHGLAKVSLFLAAGEIQGTLGTKRVSALNGASQTMPVATFAFALAGFSLVGLPPSGGFIAKWVLLQPLLAEPGNWPWAVGVLLGTLATAGYVFRVLARTFNRAETNPPDFAPDLFAQWLAMLPALLVWAMALLSEPLIFWLTEASN